MRKEVWFALISGVVLGLVIAFGVWRANLVLDEKSIVEEKTPSSSVQEIELGLEIAKPRHESVVSVDSVEVSGVTSPEARVIISSEKEDFVVIAEKDGSFTTEVDLIGGVNEIIVTSFKDDAEIVKEIVVVYSSEFNNEN